MHGGGAQASVGRACSVFAWQLWLMTKLARFTCSPLSCLLPLPSSWKVEQIFCPGWDIFNSHRTRKEMVHIHHSLSLVLIWPVWRSNFNGRQSNSWNAGFWCGYHQWSALSKYSLKHQLVYEDISGTSYNPQHFLDWFLKWWVTASGTMQGDWSKKGGGPNKQSCQLESYCTKPLRCNDPHHTILKKKITSTNKKIISPSAHQFCSSADPRGVNSDGFWRKWKEVQRSRQPTN